MSSPFWKIAYPDAPQADEEERSRIVEQTKKSFAVEAAAGSGKTYLMIQRILRSLKEGMKGEKIAAITFTEEMAGQLQIRIRDRVLQDPQLGAAHLEGIERASISTIHAFAATLLRERPLEAGVDPGFAVLDDRAASFAKASLEEDWWVEVLSSSPGPLRALAAQPGISLGTLRELLVFLAMDENREEREALLSLQAPLSDLRKGLQTVAAELVDFRSRFEKRVKNPEDGLVRILTGALPETLAAADQAGSLEALFSALAGSAAIKPGTGKPFGGGNAGSWSADKKGDPHFPGGKEIKAHAQDAILEPVGDLYRRTLGSLFCQLVPIAQEYAQRYARWKRDRGYLDFHDLLEGARRLLRDHEEVRRSFQGRFDLLVVDEFHDVDPLQVEIALLLCQDPATGGSGDWTKAAPHEGRLIVIGDPRQSIYGFRRADVGLYMETVARLAKTPCQVSNAITVNRRTVPGILRWVNGVFAPLFQESSKGVAYKDMDPLRAPAGEDPSVHLLELKGIDPDTLAEDARLIQSAALPGLIQAILDPARFPLPSDRKGADRYRYGDIAILYRKSSGLDFLEDTLRKAGIPYVLRASRGLYRTEEGMALIQVLRALDDPYDREAVAAALVSPIFGCSFDDLALLAARKAPWIYTVPEAAGLPDRVRAAYDILREIHPLRHTLPVGRVVDEVLDRTQALASFGARHLGRRRVSNLLKIRDLAHQLDADENWAFHRFVRWLGEQAREGADEGEAVLADEAHDAVTLSTIHSAKGREWPVVILVEPWSMSSGTPARILASNGKVSISAGSQSKSSPTWKAGAYEDLAAECRDKELAEEHRLQYVACTRAEDHLVLAFSDWPLKGENVPNRENFLAWALGDPALLEGLVPGKLADQLAAATAKKPFLKAARVVPADSLPPFAAPAPAVPSEAPASPWPAWQAAAKAAPDYVPWQEGTNRFPPAMRKGGGNAVLWAPATRPISSFAPPGDVEQLVASFEAFLKAVPAPPSADASPLQDRARLGRAFHLTMEHVSFPTLGSGFGSPDPASREKAIGIAVQEEALSAPEREHVAVLLERALGCPEFMALLSQATRIHREVPVAGTTADGAVVEGVLDLLLEFPDGSRLIVDYKTSADVAKGIGDYARQLAAYREVLIMAGLPSPKLAILGVTTAQATLIL